MRTRDNVPRTITMIMSSFGGRYFCESKLSSFLFIIFLCLMFGLRIHNRPLQNLKLLFVMHTSHILIGWQAYRETKYTGKIALHNPEVKSK